MKKIVLHTLFTAFILTTVQPSLGKSAVKTPSQDILHDQKKSPYKRFASWLSFQAKVTPKDIHILYTYLYKKYIRQQEPTAKETDRATLAAQRTGIKLGLLAGIITAIFAGKWWYQNKYSTAKPKKDNNNQVIIDAADMALVAPYKKSDGSYDLVAAAEKYDVDAIRVLFSKDSSGKIILPGVNALAPSKKRTVLKSVIFEDDDLDKIPDFYKSYQDRLAIGKILIENGADLNTSENGNTILDGVFSFGGAGPYMSIRNLEWPILLLENGAKVDKKILHNALMSHVRESYQGPDTLKFIKLALRNDNAVIDDPKEFDLIIKNYGEDPEVWTALGTRLRETIDGLSRNNPAFKGMGNMLGLQLGKSLYGRDLTPEEVNKLLGKQ